MSESAFWTLDRCLDVIDGRRCFECGEPRVDPERVVRAYSLICCVECCEALLRGRGARERADHAT